MILNIQVYINYCRRMEIRVTSASVSNRVKLVFITGVPLSTDRSAPAVLEDSVVVGASVVVAT